MVDVVVNHMSLDETAANAQYNTLTPFNNSGYFHPYCDIAQNVTTVSTLAKMRYQTMLTQDYSAGRLIIPQSRHYLI